MNHLWTAVFFFGAMMAQTLFATDLSKTKSTKHASLNRQSVMYGGHPEIDACGGVSKVGGLRKGGDGFLAVREAPNVKAREIDRLKNGHVVIECDIQGDWVGIVFERSAADRGTFPSGCGTSSPKKERTPYQGPCKSGWAHRKWILPEAG